MAQIPSGSRRSIRLSRALPALLCAALLAPGEGALLAQETPPAAAPEQAAKVPPDQLDSLVAPIALYPDALLAQTLVASTYPLEIVQLQQWLAKHKDLKDKALADAVAKEPWDPSIQSMAAVPEVVKRLADDIEWTTDLGNAFLDQQSDVMDAVQRMRKKAQDKGSLASNEQQKVETKVVEQKQVIVVEQSNPEVVYVPSYNPTVVYPPPVYPYPPVYYPPYTPGAALVTFGVGMAMGAAIWGGSCCGCGWGGNNVNVNVNNNFNRNTNVNRGQGGNNNWQHNSQHRGGAPYSNKATANKYGGSARGESARSGAGGAGGRGGGGAGVSDRSTGGAGGRGGGAGVSDRSAGGGGGADRAGSRDVGGGGGGSRGGSSSSAFGGGSSGGYSGSSARSSSSRGSSSMSSSRGGGGGGRGGGGGGRGGGRR